MTLPRKKILSPSFSIRPTIRDMTCFDKKLNQLQNLDSLAKQVNENVDVQLIVSVRTRFCQEWVMIQTFQDTDNMLVPQFRSFATPIQRFVQFPPVIIAQRCIVPFVRFWWFCKQVLVDTTCRNAVCTSIAIVMCSRSG